MIALLLLLAARQPPAVPPPEPLALPVPEVHHLDSGAAVWVLPQPSVPLVRIEVSWGQGYRSQPDPAAAMMAGVLAQRSPDIDRDSLEALGGRFLLGAGAERAWADVEVLSGDEAQGIAWLAAALQAPRFSGRDVRTLRRRWARARKDAWRSIGRVHNLVLSETLFPGGHPLAFRPTAADWRAVRPRAVAAAWAGLLADGAVSVFVTGNVTAEAVLGPLEAALSPYQGRGRPEPIPPPEWETPPRVILVDHMGAQRAWITHTRPAAALGAPEFHLDVLVNQVLGGMFTSRLSNRLRETDGYVYDISSEHVARPGMGRLEVTCSVALDDTADAMRAIEEELHRMATEPPDEAELEAAVRSLVLEETRRGQHLSELARPLGMALLHGMPAQAPAALLTAIQAAETEAVADRARALLGEPGGVWVVTGDAVRLSVALPDAGWDIDRVRTIVR